MLAAKSAGLVLCTALLLTACHSTGSNFSSSKIDQLQPGITTYADVVAILEADPVNRYYRPDGTYMVRWAHVSSLLPDGIYFDRELLLDFDASNYLIRISKKHNVQSAVESAPDAER